MSNERSSLRHQSQTVPQEAYDQLFLFAGVLLERLGGSVTLASAELEDMDRDIRISRSESLQDDTVTYTLVKKNA